MRKYDAIAIGGGFFGLGIAIYLKEHLKLKNILVLEKEPDTMQRASYNNQARVHNGYHYPRSVLTALRSRVNFPIFVKDYEAAIVNDFDKYYAVAHRFSKVSGRQFHQFCERIGADIKKTPKEIIKLFNHQLIDEVFSVKEYAFDSVILKKILIEKADQLGIEVKTKTKVEKVEPAGGAGLRVLTTEDEYITKNIFNCTYSAINQINRKSKLPILKLKHELAEMALIDLPDSLKNISVTVMCGPFFSFMPFPARKVHTLSHVRYTPHMEWHDVSAEDVKDNDAYLKRLKLTSHFPQMLADAKRYIPSLKTSAYKESLWEIKTVLPHSEHDDSRPILFKPHHGVRGYHCVMGGKIDNIYDAYKELDLLYA